MKRIAIVGGGISGLSAAFALEQQKARGVSLECTLFEASPRFGGVILSERVDDCLIEAGPDSFLTEKPWATELCRDLGIGDQLIGSNDSQRKTYILVNGKMVPFPDGLAFMVPTKVLPTAMSPLFSVGSKVRMMREWFHPRLEVTNDESVASFVERHYGKEIVYRIADPLLSGIYGGDARQLSLLALLPRFAKMQEQFGSLGKGMLENRKKTRTAAVETPPPLFTSLRGGMQQLVDALLLRLPSSQVRLNAPIRSLHAHGDGWVLSWPGKTQRFDCVIVAVPAHAAAKLVSDFSGIASELRGIQYSSSVTVSLGYDERVRSLLPGGFGYLAPHSEGGRVLATTFVHNKFPDRAPKNRALLRCFLGGTRDEAILELSEEEILRIVKQELRAILGLGTEPVFSRVFKWRAAMAQYNVGHLERLERIEQLRKRLPGLFFAGNAYRGIGVPDCVRSGQQAASDALGLNAHPDHT